MKDWSTNTDTSVIKDFMSHIISLAGKKRYLSEPAVSIILDMVDKVHIVYLFEYNYECDLWLFVSNLLSGGSLEVTWHEYFSEESYFSCLQYFAVLHK